MLRKLLGTSNILLVILGMLIVLCSNAAFSETIVNGVYSDDSLTEGDSTADVTPPSANATVINFDDVSAPCLFMDTVALRDQYASLGVTFAGPTGPNDGGAILNECGNFGVSGHSPPNFLAFNAGAVLSDGGIPRNPEIIKFSPLVSEVQINAGSGADAGMSLLMEAFDSTGNLLGADSIIMQPGMQTLSISANGIAAVVISSPAGIFVLDDLAFVQGGADLGAIEGYVIDSNTQDPIDGARIIIINAQTREKTATDVTGYYIISDLEPGKYWVICIKRSYKIGITSVNVLAGPPTRADFVLTSR